MYNKYHVTFLVGYYGILMCSCVVKELLTAHHGILRRFGMGGCDYIKYCEHGGIHGAWVRGVLRCLLVFVLCCGSICRDCMFVWLVLRRRWDGVSKSCKGPFYIVWHGYVYLPVLVFPIHVDPQIPFSFPILFYFIVYL